MYAAGVANPWILEANGARRRAPAWLLVVVGAVLAVADLEASRWIGPTISDGLSGVAASGPMAAVGGTALFDLAVFGPLVLIPILACWGEGRPLWLAGARPLASSAVGLVCGVGGFLATLALAALAGVVGPGHSAAVGAAALAGPAAGLALFALQAAAEEIYFRGWLQPVLCARWGPWPGLVATAVLFAGLHVIAGARSPLTLANLFLGGVVFGLLALRTGGLWAPFLAHFSWNWVEACGLGLEPNPGVGPTGALVDLDLSGAALWSGGADNLNGSLATTLVLVCLALALLALAPIRSAEP